MAHELFTELDEICVKDGKDAEWKETARSESPLGAVGDNTEAIKASGSRAAPQLLSCREEQAHKW